MRYLYLFLFFVGQCFAECNGGSSLCDKRYNEIVHLVTHDSYASSPNVAATQDDSIVDQLNNGVRGIKLSAVPSLGDPEATHLCHTFCGILDAGPVTTTLDKIVSWLEANPREVVTIMWNNLYELEVDKIAKAYESSGIMPYVYTHGQVIDAWPTIQELIDSNHRVINFIDSKANADRAPWLMDQFVHIFETPYDNTNADRFNCDVDRISPEMKAQDLMYVLNHFLYSVIDIGPLKIEIPYKEKASFINSHDSIINHAENCTSLFNKQPTFIEVDFYLIGEALEIIAKMNHVELNTTRTKPVSFQKIKKNKLEHVVIENKSIRLRASLLVLIISVVAGFL